MISDLVLTFSTAFFAATNPYSPVAEVELIPSLGTPNVGIYAECPAGYHLVPGGPLIICEKDTNEYVTYPYEPITPVEPPLVDLCTPQPDNQPPICLF